MKTTFVLSLDPDTAMFLEEIRNQQGNADPNAFINQLLRQERDRLGMPANQQKTTPENRELEQFVDQQIPSAG